MDLVSDRRSPKRGRLEPIEGRHVLTHLTHEHWDAPADKLPDRPGILIQVAAGETLIRTVEKGEMAFLHQNVGDCAPLVSRRINSCGVMGASVEDDNRPVGCAVKRREEASKVQSVCNRVVIRVCFDPEPHSPKNRMVVDCDARREWRRKSILRSPETEQGYETLTPRRVANVYLPIPVEAIIPLRKEGSEVVRARARNGLHGGNSILAEDRRAFPE